MVDIENKIFNGSKIYTNHIVDFYVGHLNPVYFPSGLGNVSLILLTTHKGSASCHVQLYPSTIRPVVYKLYACKFWQKIHFSVTVNKLLMWTFIATCTVLWDIWIRFMYDIYIMTMSCY